MNSSHITIKDVSLHIPVHTPGQQRLFKRTTIATALGGRISGSRKKATVAALNNVSLSVQPGQNLALIGPNGAGKTTLLKVMARIYPPSSGTVSVSGRINNLIEIGTGVDPEMSGYESIRFYLILHQGHDHNLDEITEDVEEFTELGKYLNLPIRTYSSGMRARLASALATSQHGDILLIDEGIGAGDSSFQEKLQARLKRFMGAAGIIVLASHNEGLLREYCQQGLVLDHGDQVFSGSLEEALEFYRNKSNDV